MDGNRDRSGVDAFVAVSAWLTGFSVAELGATGMAARYHAALVDAVEPGAYRRLIGAVGGDLTAVDDPETLDAARAVTRMWYLGVGQNARGYAESLVWKAFGGHPPGTHAPGFGRWADPPRAASSGGPR
jgi:hypothetical protein